MLCRLSLLAALVPFVSALSVSTPTNWTSGGPAIFTWTTTAGDTPVFSLELVNPTIFNQALALANNVDVSLQTISFTLPIVPATSGYTLQAVNVTNINQVFAESGSFSIGETVSSSIVSSSSASSLASGSASASATAPPVSRSSSAPFGSTVSGGASATGSNSVASGSSSSSSATPSTFGGNNNNAGSNLNLGYGSWAVMGLGAVFGVMVTL
ncbi:hypothetical protein NLI96_g6630 [Meripilus lineatus]|uniref:Ser-Thr-rich glycosyl-phosphatidyl-inositol-anchored membrane family-domain-containing protein n=1 Tax=Meripilus lineatus TaxID=2056292 RepID=A0AAD5V0K6_9APHY|nr:hypothetical protein NLI96_g6630 [Physisporinus lineatus]